MTRRGREEAELESIYKDLKDFIFSNSLDSQIWTGDGGFAVKDLGNIMLERIIKSLA
ncbi:hypothetical protein HanXRQr2_Chr04g0163451 [Helianthus annuus]|uniref:Uncharacterized protein n=1 Tax=Helianthus annuus TaxID=4232 RepID=A0A9K3NRJ9_HELAN|nr:hypothetical protein HanXRQr2_Chr04g0163451 [Helianthus annuus]KAJ0931103.1 hypothetical protein HanPSC8_Chr04g0157511 [Helianthus annuus]